MLVAKKGLTMKALCKEWPLCGDIALTKEVAVLGVCMVRLVTTQQTREHSSRRLAETSLTEESAKRFSPVCSVKPAQLDLSAGRLDPAAVNYETSLPKFISP